MVCSLFLTVTIRETLNNPDAFIVLIMVNVSPPDSYFNFCQNSVINAKPTLSFIYLYLILSHNAKS